MFAVSHCFPHILKIPPAVGISWRGASCLCPDQQGLGITLSGIDSMIGSYNSNWKTSAHSLNTQMQQMQWWEFGLCRLSSHDSLAYKTISQVRCLFFFCSIDHFQFPSHNQYYRRGWCHWIEWVWIVRLTWYLLLSYLSGSHFKKQTVHECDFADTDFRIW